MENKNKANEQNGNRRALLKALGATAAVAAVAGAGLSAPFSALAASGGAGVQSVGTVAQLSTLTGLSDGDVVLVGGYTAAGDGGAKIVIWKAGSTKADNGGTVHKHNAHSTGRFEVVHDGVGDYRWFGIMDTTLTADNAFDAMAADDSITTIAAHSDLLFRRRHKISRSNLTLDFNNHTVYTDGCEAMTSGSEERSAIFYFGGTLMGSAITRTLSAAVPEYESVYEMPYGTSPTVGDYYILMSDLVSGGGGSEREIQRMARVTQLYSSSSSAGDRVRFDYKTAYPIAAGRTMTYRRVVPIENITVRNMKFRGNGVGSSGTHPVCFEYAVRCDCINIESHGTFCAAVMRFYCNNYVTAGCSLYNPPDIETGGRGYLTQQLYCMYGAVRDCKTSMARHLNDFTASSYMSCENCHAESDLHGGFITHGQYEHDLTYINTSGLMSFAGSGATWGQRAKNISIRKHTGPCLNFSVKCTDVTAIDCHIVRDQTPRSTLAERVNGTIMANCDGAVLQNCSCSHMLYLFGSSDLSARQNVFENCRFNFLLTQAGTITAPFFTPADVRIEKDVTFKNCSFDNVQAPLFVMNRAKVSFEGCRFAGDGASYLDFRGHDVDIDGCLFESCGVMLRSIAADASAALNAGMTFDGVGVQKCVVRDTVFRGTSEIGALWVHSSATAPVLVDLEGVKCSYSNYLFNHAAASKLAGLKMSGCAVEGGSTALNAASLYTGGYVIITGNYFRNHQFVNLPSGKQAAANVTSGSTSGL